ncbi:flap endonuclease GEN [Odontomachus brunneus]|uniref:flap endonuclease GEN n=1 Tax=Odontomachus brunneus TaxID=486640 RepID=UPI0013F1AE6F|nr:flap endonuclease GEN [Odontomachus brunneus]
MGVKELWNILSPLCDRKPLYELQGKTIAIDLSGWVVDSQTVVDNAVQSKMYLRNLYFRTAFLLTQGISPVFVLEGKAPDLKHKTIARRNDIRHGFREKKIKKVGRSQFQRVLNECREMLRYMGIACVQGHGEAEAMCAYLNEDGLVDGCISQDSDCFLYGARIVYRNFSISTQGATGGFVDIYCIDQIEKILNLGRNKMIALALLCGCDYDEGINGVGKEAALKFFKTVEDDDVLQRFQEWRTDTKLDKIESNLLNPDLCTSCGHKGKLQKHTKSGCTECDTIIKCNDDYKEKRAVMLNEISLRKKALRDETFPKQELMEEFLIRRDAVPTKLDIEWKQPQVSQFIDFMDKHLCWDPQYAFEKIFTLTTRWQLLHLPNLTLDKRLSVPNLFIPSEIRKIRNIRSIASYEIIWKKEHSVLEMLKNYKKETQKNNDDDDVDDNLLTSIEPQNLVLTCYPQLVETFESIRNTKAKKRTTNSRKKKAMTDVMENNTEKKDSAKLCQKKTRKKVIEKNNRKIDEFISENRPISLEDSFEEMSISPKRSRKKNISTEVSKLEIKNTFKNTIMNTKHLKRGPQFDRVLGVGKIHSRLNNTLDRMFNELSPNDFMSENEDSDLNTTEVIEDICSKRIFEFNIRSYCPSTNQPIEGSTKIDLSEASMLNMKEHACIEDEEEKTDDSGDEFGDINESYIPINQRIQVETSKKLSCNQIEKISTIDFEDIMNETDN